MSLIVIPARKNSKRLPGKNMMLFGGKPLIYWSIKVALGLKDYGYRDVVVSSDWDDVLSYATQFGVSLRKRPDSLATDDASIYDVIKDAMQFAKITSDTSVLLLQPTSPLRTVEDVLECFNILSGNYRNLVSITEYNRKQGRSEHLRYKRNGAIYIIESSTLGDSPINYSRAYIMPPERSIDIDTEKDFNDAENIFSQL